MKILMRKIFANDFYKGSIILTVSSVIVHMANTLFTILTGRLIGPVGYGEIISFFSYVSLLAAPMSIVSTIIIQKVSSADEKKVESAYLVEKFFIEKLSRWKFLILPLLLLIPFTARITNLSEITAIFLIPMILLSILGTLYGSLLQGLRLFFLAASIGIVGILFKLAGPLLATVLPYDLFIIIFSIFLSGLVVLAAQKKVFLDNTTNLVFHRKPIENRLINIFKNRQFIITSVSLFGALALSNIDIIFVKKFYSASDAGIYSAWSFFAKIILYAIGPLISVTLIYFSSNTNLREQSRTLIFSLVFLLIAGLGGYIVYTFFGKFIIELLLSSKFINVLPHLQNASIFGILYSAILFLNNYFIAKKSYASLFVPVSLIAYCILLFLIPRSLDALITLNIFYAFSLVGTLVSFYFYESLTKRSLFRL